LIGKYAEKLKQLSNGQFVYFNRNKIDKIRIEPFENNIVKTRIGLPEPKPIEPINPNHSTTTSLTAFLRLGMILCFTVLLLGAIR